jgi:hypothetical protein
MVFKHRILVSAMILPFACQSLCEAQNGCQDINVPAAKDNNSVKKVVGAFGPAGQILAIVGTVKGGNVQIMLVSAGVSLVKELFDYYNNAYAPQEKNLTICPLPPSVSESLGQNSPVIVGTRADIQKLFSSPNLANLIKQGQGQTLTSSRELSSAAMTTLNVFLSGIGNLLDAESLDLISVALSKQGDFTAVQTTTDARHAINFRIKAPASTGDEYVLTVTGAITVRDGQVRRVEERQLAQQRLTLKAGANAVSVPLKFR